MRDAQVTARKIQPVWVVESKPELPEGWPGKHNTLKQKWQESMRIVWMGARGATPSAPPCRQKCCTKPAQARLQL